MKTRLSCLFGGLLLLLCTPAAVGSSQVLTQFPGTDGSVFAIVVDEARNRVYLAGEFTSVGGVARSNVAALSLSSGLVLPWNPGTNGDVYAMAIDPNTGVLFIGGAFTVSGGTQRLRLAAIDTDGAPVANWSPNPTSDVRSLSYRNDVLYVGGFFDQVGIAAIPFLAALDASTAALIGSFIPNPNPAPAPIYAILSTDTTVYAGGNFTSIGGAARTRVAALSSANGTASGAFTANITGGSDVRSFARSGSTLYMAGGFNGINGTGRPFLAAVDDMTGIVQSWNPSANGTCTCITIAGSKVYVGGVFSIVSGANRTRVAALDPTDAAATATAWAPAIVGSQVVAIAVSGSTVFIGGEFTQVDGTNRMGFAAVNDSDLGAPLAPVKPVLTGKGKRKITTGKSKVKLSGTSTDASLVESKVGKAAYKTTKGTAAVWNLTVRLKSPKTIVLVRAKGPGGESKPLKYTIRRK